ncbi:Uncharacterised protein [Candidatus Anstonella stagnisolia]|nr:Uncharacterised protein [Candidatus Anstonella stagnisolia]
MDKDNEWLAAAPKGIERKIITQDPRHEDWAQIFIDECEKLQNEGWLIPSFYADAGENKLVIRAERLKKPEKKGND